MADSFIVESVKSTWKSPKNLYALGMMIFLTNFMRWIDYHKYMMLGNYIFVIVILTSAILLINSNLIYHNSYPMVSRFEGKFSYEQMKIRAVILNTMIFMMIILLSIELNDFLYSITITRSYILNDLMMLKYFIRLTLYLLIIQSLMIIFKNLIIKNGSNTLYTFVALVFSIILTQMNDYLAFFYKTHKFYYDFYISSFYLESSSIKDVVLLNVHILILFMVFVFIILLFSKKNDYDL